MPRTDFHTMYTILKESDKETFKSLIGTIQLLFNPMIFKANMSTHEGKIPVREGSFHIANISVADWLQSIVSPPDEHGKDLLSPPRDYLTELVKSYYTEYSMGALGLDSKSRNPIFEFRCARKMMHYKPTTGGNLVENIRILFKNVTEVTGDKKRADSDTSSDTIDTRNQILTSFQEAREFLGGNSQRNTFWKFPTKEAISDVIEKIRRLPFDNDQKERMCNLLESSRSEFREITPKEKNESKLSYIKRVAEINTYNGTLPIFTNEIIPLVQTLLFVLNETEIKNIEEY